MKTKISFNVFFIFFVISFLWSCIRDIQKESFKQGSDSKKTDILKFIESYEFSDSIPNASNNYEFPVMPKLNEAQASELFKRYETDNQLTKRTIVFFLLKMHYANLKCCGMQYSLVDNQVELDSIRNPITFLYLKFSSQYIPEKMYAGIGTSNVQSFVEDNPIWKQDTSLQHLSESIEKLDQYLEKRNSE
jgi:hypothetical protein